MCVVLCLTSSTRLFAENRAPAHTHRRTLSHISYTEIVLAGGGGAAVDAPCALQRQVFITFLLGESQVRLPMVFIVFVPRHLGRADVVVFCSLALILALMPYLIYEIEVQLQLLWLMLLIFCVLICVPT